jgi:hypothetical protein
MVAGGVGWCRVLGRTEVRARLTPEVRARLTDCQYARSEIIICLSRVLELGAGAVRVMGEVE